MAEALFKQLDANGDGSVSYEEVKAFVSSKRPIKNEQLLQLIFKAIDIDGNGEIDLAEFTKFAAAVKEQDLSDEKVGLKILYKLMDADGDGKLTKEEVTTFFKKFGYEKVVDQIMKADANADGYITLEEFLAFNL
ncbi:calcium binding protein chain a, putative [Entamoeba histolytica HM-3:IMSS]|uniref:Calcium binding protein chain a, putative n=1 Tax=Entamoeba histolytica HM-3:IMSS TaxID=885315 RepID=M7X1C1_ENTHI|nr:calcium binding protein chain a, putative [Entamoeba histolytica HM-3:IMSS]